MVYGKNSATRLILLTVLDTVYANECGACLSNGALAGVIFASIALSAVLTLTIVFLLWRYCKTYRVNGSIVEPFAFDNPDYRKDEETNVQATMRNCGNVVRRSKINANSITFVGSRWRNSTNYQSTESLGTVSEYIRVPLVSKDFTGLGFSIYGNMRDGIFVKSLLNRGPAKEAGNIQEGDRIVGIEIRFESMAFEDALTILSYASPYPITLEIKKYVSTKPNLQTFRLSRTYSTDRQAMFHPLVKSQSITDMTVTNGRPMSITSNTLDRRSKSVQYASDTKIIKLKTPDKECQANVAQSSPIEVVPETNTDMEPLSKMFIRKLSECKISMSSSDSMNESLAPSKVTVTAEINQRPSGLLDGSVTRPPRVKHKGAAPVPQNNTEAFENLNYEDKMQILRISYEDPAMSQSTPNLSRPTSDTEETVARPGHQINYHNPNSRYPIGTVPEISSQTQIYHSNGLTVPNNDIMAFEKEHYEKLLYFQNQLARQHEELSKLGISIPAPTMNTKFVHK